MITKLLWPRPKIVNRCLSLAMRCKKMDVPITTFMIAQDPYLVQFVEAFTANNNEKRLFLVGKDLGRLYWKVIKTEAEIVL